MLNGNGASMEAAPIIRETYATVNVASGAPMHTSVPPWMVACPNDITKHSISDFDSFGKSKKATCAANAGGFSLR